MRAETMDRFATCFEPCGLDRKALSTCYGLAESTLLVVGSDLNHPVPRIEVDTAALETDRILPAKGRADRDGSTTLVSSGHIVEPANVVIVDTQTLQRCPTGHVGEIWVAGPSVTQGYWQRPKLTRETFEARLADTGEGPFLRTGDLGFIEDEQLYVTGRLKDLIIVRGRNLYPQDIERTAEQAHPAVRPGCCAAFGTQGGSETGERVTLVAELRTGDSTDPQEVIGALRAAVAASHQVVLEQVVLIAARSIPKTSSGKIRRKACRAKLADGSLAVQHRSLAGPAPLPLDEAKPKTRQPQPHASAPRRLSLWLTSWLARELNVSESAIEVKRPFAELGVDSILAEEASAALETHLQRPIPSALFWNYPTIEALAAHLAPLEPTLRPARAASPPPPAACEPDDAIAIIGMGCRFPGDVFDAASFWRLLSEGRDAITEVPSDRWNLDDWFAPDPDAIGKMYTRWGGFLADIERFDPGFFDVSPREAVSLDPQQRLLLEVSWEAIENSGITAGGIRETDCGVYMGICGAEYLSRALQNAEAIDAYAVTGGAHSTSVGRLSYWLGLHGPNLPVDTACSSSLVALHLACQALRSGECSMALAGGVNSLLSPESHVYFSRLRAMSPEGRCKTFDATADGYVRAEGCGVLVLTRLSTAQREGHRILAVIRGSAVNQDGRSNGLTAPNGQAQEALIREALRQANRQPRDIDYVECHGTGTPLGDPVEVNALASVLGEGREAGSPVMLGSVKSNFGHTEGAAGIAGVIKTMLALGHQRVPKSLHVRTLNPRIRWDKLAVRVAAEELPWEGNDRPRLAGVSSFGFSGTNAHVILEEAPRADPDERAPSVPGPVPSALPLVLSGRTVAALQGNATRLAAQLRTVNVPLLDTAFSLAATRTALATRAALVIDADASHEEVADQLDQLARGERSCAVQRPNHRPGKLAVLFTGQGSQRLGMGKELAEVHPVFGEKFAEVVGCLDTHLERPLLEIMHAEQGSPEAALLSETRFTQPALFALEVALYRLWETWGVKTDFLLGYSIGELIAAHVAGVLSLDDACRLVCARARLMQVCETGGAMVSIEGSEAEVATELQTSRGRVNVAGSVGPRQTVISGDEATVLAVGKHFEHRGRRTTRLNVSHAFHSAHMEGMLEEYRAVARTCTFNAPRVAIVSNLTGELARPEDFTSADYWVQQLRHAVRFNDGMQTLWREGVTTYLECGPNGVLCEMATGCVPNPSEASFIPSLRPQRGEALTLNRALGSLYVAGHDLNWKAVFRGTGAKPVDLPTYAFQRQRYWRDATPETTAAGDNAAGHELLGVRQWTLGPEVQFSTVVGLNRQPYLADHRYFGNAVVSAAYFVSMLVQAQVQTQPSLRTELRALEFIQPLIVDTKKRVQLAVLPAEDGSSRLSIVSAPRGDDAAGWHGTTHVTGHLTASEREGALQPVDLARLRRGCLDAKPPSWFYDRTEALGVTLGPRFQCIDELWLGDGQALARLTLPGDVASAEHGLHPVVLDGCFQLVAGVLAGLNDPDGGDPFMPIAVDRVVVEADASGPVWAHAKRRTQGQIHSGVVTADVVLFRPDGTVVVRLEGLSARAVQAGSLDPASRSNAASLYEIAWAPAPNAEADPAAFSGSWLVVSPSSKLGASIVEKLKVHGATQAGLVNSEHPHRFLRKAVEATNAPLAGVVCHWEAANDEAASEQAQRVVVEGLETLKLVLERAEAQTTAPRIVWVTTGAQAVVDGDRPQPAMASLWGMARVWQHEHREIQSLIVDVEAGASAKATTDSLWTALAAPRPECAVRNGEPYVPQLQASTMTLQTPSELTPVEGVVLITGGLGALGLAVAQWLVDKEIARHLVLVGRSAPTPEALDIVTALRAAGARVEVRSADVARRSDVTELLASLPEHPPISGVIHAAGVLEDGVLAELDPEALSRVMAPKVSGAWNLHELTKGRDLDFFLLFSSVASLFGPNGQGSYAAANAFLDGLAHHRRAQELPGTTINWGPWSETGMAASMSGADQARAARKGVAF
ncbi:MAG: SDR family NAD(P)-dependent oxidoreductase, partial [Planctomycetota bacterium]